MRIRPSWLVRTLSIPVLLAVVAVQTGLPAGAGTTYQDNPFGSAGTVTVGYATADGTARAGLDYAAASGTLTFPPGVTTETIPVVIYPDWLIEGPETFMLNLQSPSGATIVDGQGVGTILDRPRSR